MSVAKWATPSTRSSSFASTAFDSLANGSESNTVTYDNSTNKDLYGLVTIKLGSITPTTGGSVTLRVTISDGTDTADRVDGELYTFALTTTASAKVLIKRISLVGGFSLRFSLINNAGVALAASGNAIHVTPYNEDIV
jgi:hypothetical protein